MDDESKKPAEHEYDVAISFLARDEPLARDIAERLAPLRVFVYSKAQEKLAGQEGVEAFRTVFRDKARLALILFRSGWGQSPWTRVEEVAIRDHCLAEGWNHQMFVQLERGDRPEGRPVLARPLCRWRLMSAYSSESRDGERCGLRRTPATALPR